MAQETKQLMTVAPALISGLSVCMLCLLVLVGFKLRWFRARLKMGELPAQQPTLETGIYRRTFSDDLPPRRVPRASTKILSQYRSMPDLALDTSEPSTASNHLHHPKPKAQTSIFQKKNQTEAVPTHLMNGTANTPSPAQRRNPMNGITNTPSPAQARNPLTKQLKDNSVPKMKLSTPDTSRSSSPVYEEASDPKQSKPNPQMSPMGVRNPMLSAENQNLKSLDFIPIQNSRFGTPLSSRSSSPIMFGEAPLNHRADRMDSLFMAPEIGVPFARGNPLPSWANTDTESTGVQKKKSLPKDIHQQENDQRKMSVFPSYEEFDT